MIELTDLGNKKHILNCDLIEKIESVPDTKILLTNGKKYLVKESIDEVLEKVMNYKKQIFRLIYVRIKVIVQVIQCRCYFKFLEDGDCVSFEIERRKQGLAAENVTVI